MALFKTAEAKIEPEAPKAKDARSHHARQLEVEGVQVEVESHNPPMRFHVASRPGASRVISEASARSLVKFLQEVLADAD